MNMKSTNGKLIFNKNEQMSNERTRVSTRQNALSQEFDKILDENKMKIGIALKSK